jgi:hypothetical protein
LLASALLIGHTAFALVEDPAGTLIAESDDGSISYRVFDSDANMVPDVEVTGATNGDGIYLNIDTIDSTAASSPGSIIVDVSADTNWTITASNGGILTVLGWATLSFSGIEDLNGFAGSDTFNLFAPVSGTINGGAGADEIVGDPIGNAFIVNATDAGTLNGSSFANVENLTGSASADTFTFAAALTGVAAGGAGDDVFEINDGGIIVQTDGGAGNDTQSYAGSGPGVTISVSALINIENLVGSASDDFLQGTVNDDVFIVDSPAGGTVGSVQFQSIENYDGLAGNDTFTVSVSGAGAYQGGAGDDTFTFLEPGGGVDGGPGTDEIIGHDAGNTFVVNAGDAGTANGQAFFSIENLTGGSAADTFTFTAALSGAASGQSGGDVFNINNGGSAGASDGGGGSDTLTYAGSTGPITVSVAGVTNMENLVGSASSADILQGSIGNDVFVLSTSASGTVGTVAFSDFENFDGLEGIDEIVGVEAGNTVNVTGIDAGSVNGQAFSNIENLTGSPAADTFTFTAALSGSAQGENGDDVFEINDGGSAGAINGGANLDTVSYANMSAGVTISLADLVAIENVVGSAFDDIFNLGGDFSGSVDGGAGTDTVVGTADANFFVVIAGSITVDGATFTNIESIDGAGGSDTIIGAAVVNNFVINSSDAGTVSFTDFANIENLVGGTGNDTFTFNAPLSGSANGGDGDDVFDLAANLVVTINGGVGNDEVVINGPNTNDLGISNVETITYVPDQVIFRVQGLVNFVSPELAGVFSIGDHYDLIYTFEATTPDSTASASIGNYDAVIYTEVKVGSYSASFSSFLLKRITVQNNVSGFDRYRVDLSGINGPRAAGLPLGDQFPILQLTDFAETAFADDTLPVDALDLNDFGVDTFLALFFDLPDESQARVQASVDSFDVIQSFRDVPASYWAARFITKLAVNSITGGCGLANFCPEDQVTRAQMAVFLERGMRGGDFVPPAASGNVFLDVAANAFAAAFIEQLANDGITGGCGNNNYCPNNVVTRAQMAVFLLRAKYGSGYSPPPAQGIFDDVDLSYWAVDWIEQLAAEGITSGCGGGNFCPDQPATRAQMAVFLVRTFGL